MTWRSIARLQCRLLLYTQANWHWLEGAVMFTTPLLLLFLRAFYHEPRRSVCVSFCPSLSLCVHDWQCDVMWYNYVILIKHWATSSWLLFLCVCMCMYVCMCVCVYVCMCVCVCVNIHWLIGMLLEDLRWCSQEEPTWDSTMLVSLLLCWDETCDELTCMDGKVTLLFGITEPFFIIPFSPIIMSLVYGSLTCLLCMVLWPVSCVWFSGLVEELHERGLLPRVMSGSSAGSLMAGNIW